MRLLINIPEEFEQHFQADRFEDSLHRLSADAHLLAGNYEQETAVMLIESFKSAVPVQPHGDLIGRDWLIDIALHLMNTAKNDDISNGVKWLWQYIIEAPTIIPAEEEDDG